MESAVTTPPESITPPYVPDIVLLTMILLPEVNSEILVPAERVRTPERVFRLVTPPLLPPPVDPDTPITIVFPDVYSEILVPAERVMAPEREFSVVTPPLLPPPVDPDTPITILFPDVYSEILVPAVRVMAPDSEFRLATPEATPPVYGTPLIVRDVALIFWFWNIIPPTEWGRVGSVVVNVPVMTVKFPLLSNFNRCVSVPPVQKTRFVSPPNAPIWISTFPTVVGSPFTKNEFELDVYPDVVITMVDLNCDDPFTTRENPGN
jgi:hypothetical protein